MTMKQLNHLKTFESFTTNEEFNPFKKNDWKAAGNYLRKGVGFLSEDEKLEQAKDMVLSHPVRSKIYHRLLSENPHKAEEYIMFWAEHDERANPVWNEKKYKFEDKAQYNYNTGVGGIGSW